jgi:hypothetical protein
MKKHSGKNLSDLEAALAEYALQQVTERGLTLEEVCDVLVRGGCPDLSVAKLEGWMKVAGQQLVEDDPLDGERDEARRAEKLEVRLAEAAESIPGAADLLGLDRLRAAVVNTADLSGPSEDMAAVLVKALDFLVPELMVKAVRIVATRVSIPKGGRWEVWDGGESRVMVSTLAIFNAEGDLVALKLRMRPRGPAKMRDRALQLPVRAVQLVRRADLRAIAQRILQYAAEFRPGRHARVSQLELADACDRTKQAISHQRRLLTKKVKVSTQGRAGFRGVRNVKGKGGRG